jgi:hypothetical protein
MSILINEPKYHSRIGKFQYQKRDVQIWTMTDVKVVYFRGGVILQVLENLWLPLFYLFSTIIHPPCHQVNMLHAEICKLNQSHSKKP